MASLRAEGRRFRAQLTRSKAARDAALATVAAGPFGWWVARIGGAVRGRLQVFPSRAKAVDAVTAHYNAALFRQVVRGRTRT